MIVTCPTAGHCFPGRYVCSAEALWPTAEMRSLAGRLARLGCFALQVIKTSSLRALIELTFQRNWNGLIWMSRKGVITKRGDCPDGSIENSAQPRSPAGRGTHVPRSAKMCPSV
ncbi:unnamed protein product [Microthlaspi erraticum]|uniref:Uncharacterized protein n=1 Tax=Microthlaspi erraticum TaxID=1685480 RepID=A0A6D2JUV5_9BRAS|nr:unnamed protein product [Microthlaspi erraticum]